jgi:hypothetical protein
MAKGTAIVIKAEARDGKFATDADLAVKAVNDKYEAQMRSQQGWYGIAVVNLLGDEARALEASTVLVKVTAKGADVFAFAGSVANTVKVTTGKFKSV